MFADLRARLEKQGFGYLSDNNVLRYLNSYLWNIDTAEMRLVNTEKWRMDNDCMKVNINEIRNELGMKVTIDFMMIEMYSSYLFMAMTSLVDLWFGLSANDTCPLTLMKQQYQNL